MKKIVPQSVKNIYHLAQAIIANVWYGFPVCNAMRSIAGRPSRKIKVIGVTGTNGKTTTCWMIAKILEEAGNPVKSARAEHGAGKVAMASTINFKLDKKEWVNKTKFTTLSSFAVQKFIKKAVDEKCEYLVLETSSHSLDQNRVWGVKYDVAVITNITREHLDYHETMEKYRAAKLKLFKNVKTAVVNLDMEKPEEFLNCGAEEKYGYTTKFSIFNFQFSNNFQCLNSEIKKIAADDIELGVNYSKFKIQNSKFTLNLLGKFNIENALAAVCVGLSQNISLETCARALEKIKVIPGRMDEVENNLGVKIIIDYALTPDSMEKLGALILGIKNRQNKLIWVFGSCGERDRGKRPMMGEIVSLCADYIIVTNEDPYGEDPMQIIDEVASGVKNKKEGENFWKIFDRREAIAKALKLAKKDDIILITGKGAEETMAIGEKRIKWNDKKVIIEELKNLSR